MSWFRRVFQSKKYRREAQAAAIAAAKAGNRALFRVKKVHLKSGNVTKYELELPADGSSLLLRKESKKKDRQESKFRKNNYFLQRQDCKRAVFKCNNQLAP